MKNIVFDFGGVVFQWRPAELLRRTLPHRAVDEAAAQQLVLDFFQNYQGDWGRFDRGTIEIPELAPLIARRLGFEIGEVQAVIDAIPGELEVQKATVDLLYRLHDRGHRLFFLSNMPEPYAAHLAQAHPLTDWFESGVFSSHVKQIKPSAEMFAIAERRFGVPPQELLFLDDHPVNVDAALSRDWQAFLFTDTASARRELVSRRLLSA